MVVAAPVAKPDDSRTGMYDETCTRKPRAQERKETPNPKLPNAFYGVILIAGEAHVVDPSWPMGSV